MVALSGLPSPVLKTGSTLLSQWIMSGEIPILCFKSGNIFIKIILLTKNWLHGLWNNLKKNTHTTFSQYCS